MEELLLPNRSSYRPRLNTMLELQPLQTWRNIQLYVIKTQAVLNVLRAVPMIVLGAYSLFSVVLCTGVFLFFGRRGLTPVWRESYLWVYVVGMGLVVPIEIIAFILATNNIDKHWSASISDYNWSYYTYLCIALILILLDILGLYFTTRMIHYARIKPEKVQPLLSKRKITRGSSKKKKIQYKGTRIVSLGGYGAEKAIPISSSKKPKPVSFVSNEVTKTHYNILNFLPKFLIFQFSRLANLYTLCIVCLSTFDFSPIDPVSSLFPLLCVIFAAAAKEINEDMKRRANDDEINNRVTRVLDNDVFVDTLWKDVKVGQIVKVLDKELFPCDMLLLSSSREKGTCYVETANLDGESNLKLRTSSESTNNLLDVHNLQNMRMYIECEQPNTQLYKFDGTLHFEEKDDESVSRISVDAILLRGCILRNTEFIYGVVINTGTDTKVEQNATDAPHKRSGVERRVNDMLVWMFFMQMFICVYCSLANANWELADNATYSTPWYIYDYNGETEDYIFLSYIILYNTLIPLSMYVSMEVIRFANARWIDEDIQMRDENGKFSTCRNSTIMEDLGQIRYVFTDKTGTLTCNEMVFVGTHIGDIRYGSFPSHIFNQQLLKEHHKDHSDKERTLMITNQILNMAICHTTQPEHFNKDNYDNITYQAESPDELAFVLAAKDLGIHVVSRTASSITLRIKKNSPILDHNDFIDSKIQNEDNNYVLCTYEILQVLPFDNLRKRMSILVRCPSGRIKLYCKGADDSMKLILRTDSMKNWKSCDESLTYFAHLGLRTLVFGEKYIEDDEYKVWATEKDKIMLILNPEEFKPKFNDLIGRMERRLYLCGCSAVEDRLAENVPSCISALRNAGIRVWVLTGDKQETAISIGHSSCVLNDNMRMFIFNQTSEQDVLNYLIKLTEELSLDSPTGNVHDIDELIDAKEMGIVINGPTLEFILSEKNPNHRMESMFLNIAKLCKSVICCRCAPLQKSAVVRLVSERSVLFGDGAITLAIGDGANDVSMIQEADVGIGISGKEGMQAVLASDFALPQFSFLQKLLLVHGYNSYRRISKVILYCFCKNFALAITGFWFSFFSKFSGQLVFFDLLFTMYNALFTALPILSIGVSDQDVDEWVLVDTIEGQAAYRTGIMGIALNNYTFGGWVLLGVWHSAVLFFFGFFGMNDTLANGQMLGLWELGSVSFTCLVIAMSIQVGMIARSWKKHLYITLVISIITYWGFIFIYCSLSNDMDWLFQADSYSSFHHVVVSGSFWFTIIIAPLVGVAPNYIIKCVMVFFMPSESYSLALTQRKHYHMIDEEVFKQKRLDSVELLSAVE